MRPECVRAVAQALGREPKPGELAEIETRLTNEVQRMARKDRQAIIDMTPAERMMKAAENAANDLAAEAELKARRKVLAVQAQSRIRSFMDVEPKNRLKRLEHVLRFDAGGSGIQSIEAQAREIANTAFGDMLDTLISTNPKILGLFEDTAGTEALVKELHGEDSGNPQAKAGAKVFHETGERLRQRFNRAGGDIGKLESYDMPHHHSHAKIAAAGLDKWVKAILPRLKREMYVKDDGSLMDDAEVEAFMREAGTTILTDGANKWQAGAAGVGGSRANRGSAHRQIHFKDAQSHIDYWHEFGEKSLFDVIQGHVRGIANDIAMVETLGPNADHGFKELLDYAVNMQKVDDKANAPGLDGKAKKLETLYRYIAGSNGAPANVAAANVMRGLRSLQTGAKLGSAIISSVTDHATMWNTALFNNMKYSRVLMREMDLLRKPEMREAARRAGLGLDAMLSGLDRWGTEGLGDAIGLSGKFADRSQKLTNAVMRASGLSQVTDIRRQAFAVEMMDVVGSLSRKGWEAIDESDRTRLQQMGIDKDDFAVWQMAEVADLTGRGDKVLTPKAIYSIPDDALAQLGDPAALKDKAATRLAAMVGDESRMAIIEPGARERAFMYGGSQAGTFHGELFRSFWQFKSFGIAMAMRHIERGRSIPTKVGKTAYLARHIVGTTLLGGIAVLLSDILSGKDPRDITNLKFLGAAFTKGGSMGIYGDFLYGGKTKYGDTLASIVGGPISQFVLQPYQIAADAVTDAKEGRPVDVAGKGIQYIKGNTPGMSLWYTKAALDHLIWHDAMEFANPGYLRRMKQRTQRDTGQKYWWEPGENLPDRAPDMGAALGQ